MDKWEEEYQEGRKNNRNFQMLNSIAKSGAGHFNELHTGTEDEKGLDGLGILISQWTEWDGLAIMMIFRSALEDANFHKEAAIVQKWMEGS
jgi:hypothetical protein